MTSVKSSLHIVLAFDGGYWAPAYATMRSICLTSTRRVDLVFHLCCYGLTPDQRADLEAIKAEFGAHLEWHDLDRNEQFQTALSNLKDSKRLGTVIYARLMLEAFLPETAERAVYIDCDVMVLEAIECLWDVDLNGRTIGAVRDPWGLLHAGGRDLREKRDLYDPANGYFNSGLLVVDLRRWREAKVWGRLQEVIASGTMARLYYDQDFLNIVFQNDWHALDQRWNMVEPRPEHQALYPFIVHYTGYAKPWNIFSRVAFSRIYRHVMTNELFYRYWRFRMKKRLAKVLPFIKMR